MTTRDREAETIDLQPVREAKGDALAARIKLMEKQQADELARFPAAPAPKAKKSDK